MQGPLYLKHLEMGSVALKRAYKAIMPGLLEGFIRRSLRILKHNDSIGEYLSGQFII